MALGGLAPVALGEGCTMRSTVGSGGWLCPSGSSYPCVSITPKILETCVKNCGLRFHVKIAQRDFLNDLLRIIQLKV